MVGWKEGLALAGLIGIPAVALCAGSGKSVWDGIYSQAQATRGEAQYQQSCAVCHGEGYGGGDSAPPLTGSGFLANWSGQDAGALFTRIKTTMPLTRPGSLSSAQVADIEAAILAHNDFPAGTADLPADPNRLADVAISEEKPTQ